MLIFFAVTGAVQGAVEPVISGDSTRGQKIFEEEQCVRCHSINGRGGKMGVDFSLVVSRNFTPAQLASTMWNHAPVMYGAMETAGIEQTQADARRRRRPVRLLLFDAVLR